MKTFLRINIATIVAASLHCIVAQETPTLVPFQGRLTDQDGVAVSNGVRVVQFKMYNAPVGGQAVWNGEVQKLTVNNGLISTVLGTKAGLSSVNFNQSLYLEITIDANDDGQIGLADPPLLPRQSIFSVPAAKFASEAGSLDGFSWSDLFTDGNPKTGSMALGEPPSAILPTDEPGPNNTRLLPPLEIFGRPRIRQRPGGYNAGIWLYQAGPGNDRAFIGMRNDDTVAFYGRPGADYGLFMDVNNLTVTIPRTLNVGTVSAGTVSASTMNAGALTVNGNLSAQTLSASSANISRLDASHIILANSVDFGAGNTVYRFLNSLGIQGGASLQLAAPAIYVNGTLWTTSDGRLKRNVRPLRNALDKIGKIKGVTYEFDPNCTLAQVAKLSLPIESQVGLIAQDIEAVLPEAVCTNEEGIRSVNYNAITSLLIEAVKEQQRQIEELRSEVAALREQKK